MSSNSQKSNVATSGNFSRFTKFMSISILENGVVHPWVVEHYNGKFHSQNLALKRPGRRDFPVPCSRLAACA